MGRINLALSFPTEQTVSVIPKQSPAAPSSKEGIGVQHVETVSSLAIQARPDPEEQKATKHYPFHPRTRRTEDLPFVNADEVATRNGKDGNRLWIVVDGVVLDCTEFQSKHPAGKGIIEGFGGHDCTWQWWSFHSAQIMQKIGNGLRVARTANVPNKHERPLRRKVDLPVAGEQW